MLRRWAPLAAAISVVAVVVSISLFVSGRSPGEPPPLRLAGGSTDAAMSADAPALGKRAASGSPFRLVGPLPSGPDEARAQSLPAGAADEDDVRRLAVVLGITAEPLGRIERAWQVGALRVEDAAGRPWSLSASCGPDAAVSSDGGTVTCSAGSGSSGSAGSTEPAQPAPAPAVSPCPDNARCAQPGWVPPAVLPPMPSLAPVDVDAARDAARTVLARLGLKDADISVDGGAERDAFVRADPRVDGLPTSGYSTYLQLDAEDRVVSGSGYLAWPEAGESYQLISAREAFDALPEPPRPMMACQVETDCPEPAPAEVTGAELGLQLTALADERAALLPAWLFTVKDWPIPLAQAAIEPRFLAPPKADPPRSDQPTRVDPVPIDPGPTGERSLFGFDSVFPADDPKSVVVQYGDSGSCPHTNVTHAVKESADSVVVLLEGDAQPTDQICTSDYRQMLVTVVLQEPLGKRTVIDGSRGEPVALDRTCSRPMGAPAAQKDCKR